MSLADTSQAVGAVSDLLKEYLLSRTGLDVTVGRPEPGTKGGKRLNLFLYEASFDPGLKNVSLFPDRPAPLWLVLKYLVTPFDDEKESDTYQAHQYMGLGLRALQDLALLKIGSVSETWVPDALKDNPEELKITFDEVNADLLSKLMQGSDEKYRFSMGFQVRPVLVSPGEPPETRKLVGINYTPDPPIVLPHEVLNVPPLGTVDVMPRDGLAGVQVMVLAAFRAEIAGLSPNPFEAQDVLTVFGQHFEPGADEVLLDGQVLALDPDPAKNSDTQLTCTLPAALINGGISAGAKTLVLRKPLPPGHHRTSNPVIANLRPAVTGAVFTSHGLDLDGVLLGAAGDDIQLALCQGDTVVKYYDTFLFDPADPEYTQILAQQKLKLVFPSGQVPAPGTYRVVLQVNGQQAFQRPAVTR